MNVKTKQQDQEEPMAIHQPCPDCGSSDAMTVWSTNTYCHSCEKSRIVKLDDAIEPKATKGNINMGLEATPKITKSVTKSIRSIDKDVVEFYGVTVGTDGSGNDIAHKYPYPNGKDKYRYLPKDFSHNKGFTNDCLFGADKFNASTSKAITIVEGELDAMSAYQMLGKRWPVVSLPAASTAPKVFKNQEMFDYVNSFQQVVVCTDNDKAGEAAAKKIAGLFPNKVYRVKMTNFKDANEFLEAGKQKDFLFAWVNREKYTPSGIYNTEKQFKGILGDEESNEYIETPIEVFNGIAKGLMQGHLTVITGPEGQGKTEVMRMLEYNILSNHPDVPIAVLHMEESKKTTLISLASYKLGINLRDPDHTVPTSEVEEAVADLTKSENLYLFEMGIDEDPETIVDKVRYFREACGCKYIFIDPIQQLAYGKDRDSSEEQVLSKISVQLERVATEFNIGVVLTAHVNDDGKTRSSRMIGKSASVRIDLQRDHMNTDPDIANITKLFVSKNRPVGPTGFGGMLKFDLESFTLSEEVE